MKNMCDMFTFTALRSIKKLADNVRYVYCDTLLVAILRVVLEGFKQFPLFSNCQKNSSDEY